jgi:predicted DNA-binding ArsR family transcriptional regulator
MSKEKNTDCPICNGTGKIESPYKMKLDGAEVKRQIAVDLQKKGYSLRQIQHALGYKSVRSVHYLVHKDV